ncbi:hypothetical protein [Streptomyces cavernae]|uniref:hypothetical protein n=1 Tax=Streptomyces cavernae TaxID=2259034 RepID=UPI001391C5D6|nr:hypothetical protein [Streptomyces cavernae]
MAVALGVAVVTMSALVLLSDGTRVPERLAGAPVLVQSPAGRGRRVFAQNPPWAPERAEELRRKLAELPGGATAVADRPFYAQAAGSDQREGEQQGHPWSTAVLATYGLNAGGQARAAMEDQWSGPLPLPPQPGPAARRSRPTPPSR